MTGIKVTNLSEDQIEQISRAIGDSFFDYEYAGQEYGLKKMIPDREMMYRHMKACFLAGYKSGCLYATSERGEGYIIVTHKGHNILPKCAVNLARTIVRNFGGLRKTILFYRELLSGGKSYESELKARKIPYANLGMLVVLKEYQGQGYMRKLMEMLYEIADEQGLAIVFDTDARKKADQYVHLGMTLAKTRKIGEGTVMYDLYRPAQGRKARCNN